MKGVPRGHYNRQSILKIPSPPLQGLSIHYCGITIFFAQSLPLLPRTFFLHVSRSSGAFAQALFRRVRSPVVPLIGGAIWWVAEPQTVLLWLHFATQPFDGFGPNISELLEHSNINLL
ncbi:hypothetical protein AVEN_22012-1 [Araneus ventricosus]|uniref:Uncharacterized protein n=1 Tax=Araneus ventricosus TaxID=182803 RepID=A0A4Y2P997_ARAVE|nr:hypothetical protein AVEN_22012-1 [Araneus ventricosus]